MPQRLVIDANIFASALIKPSGTPGLIISNLFQSPDLQVIFTPGIQSELERILFYPKVRKYISLKDEEIKNWLDALMIISYFFVPKYKYEPIVLEDPYDDIYIIAALEGSSNLILSGDQHLIKLNGLNGINIINPREYWEIIKK